MGEYGSLKTCIFVYFMQCIQRLEFTLAVRNCQGFCRGKQCFYSNYLGKNIAEVIIPSKIYIQFTIFNTYFSTKLSLTDKRYHLHVIKKWLYVLQKVRSIICFQQFIHPHSLMFLNSFFHLIFFRSRTRCYRVSNSCSNVLINMIFFGKKK